MKTRIYIFNNDPSRLSKTLLTAQNVRKGYVRHAETYIPSIHFAGYLNKADFEGEDNLCSLSVETIGIAAPTLTDNSSIIFESFFTYADFYIIDVERVIEVKSKGSTHFYDLTFESGEDHVQFMENDIMVQISCHWYIILLLHLEEINQKFEEVEETLKLDRNTETFIIDPFGEKKTIPLWILQKYHIKPEAVVTNKLRYYDILTEYLKDLKLRVG